MNRELRHAPDGSLTLRPGDFYRLVVVVNGATTLDSLERALGRLGFTRLLTAAPADWDRLRPRDWPPERPVETAANECIVRAQGLFAGRFLLSVVPDIPIEQGASFRVAQAWDYAPHVVAGAAPPQRRGATAALVVTSTLVGLGLWSLMRNKSRMDRASERLASAEMRADRAALTEDMGRLLAMGHTPSAARELAEGLHARRAVLCEEA
jgi:hypothetical protein